MNTNTVTSMTMWSDKSSVITFKPDVLLKSNITPKKRYRAMDKGKNANVYHPVRKLYRKVNWR